MFFLPSFQLDGRRYKKEIFRFIFLPGLVNETVANITAKTKRKNHRKVVFRVYRVFAN